MVDTTAVKELETQVEEGAVALKDKLEADAAQFEAQMKELKSDLGCAYSVLRFVALTLALLIGGLLFAILFILISLALIILALIFLIVAVLVVVASVLGVIASTIGLALTPIAICITAPTVLIVNAKLKKARTAFALQYQKDVEQLNAFITYVNENQEELLTKLVKKASSLTPAISAIISRTESFFGPGGKNLTQVRLAPAA